MGSTSQQYCLRWNNHRANLLAVFDDLLRSEAFTDVTLACEGGTSVKCHKMVLAACSTYFQSLFSEVPCQHPVVVLKDVKYGEMKAILEYMYRGEVNVAQDHLAALLKVAEALKVKGLVEENGPLAGRHGHIHGHSHDRRPDDVGPAHSPPGTTTPAAAPHSSVSPTNPTGATSGATAGFDRSGPYNLYGKSPVGERTGAGGGGGRLSLPVWAVPGLPLPHHPAPIPPPSHPHAAAAGVLGGCYDAASDMSPLKRKKLQSLLLSRDTPILRTVLGQGQGQADSSQQPMSLVCQPDSHERVNSNGSDIDTDRQIVKAEQSVEEERSPYTDISNMDEDISEKNNKMMLSQTFPNDMRAVSSGIATYVPTQKPEWKRYKQYTRNDIMSAIEAVRTGMSALQAARKYGVPSRTLYDKVKKMGITTSRPFNKRGSNVSPGGYFPYGGNGGSSAVFGGGGTSEGDDQVPTMEPLFLQHALDGMKREIGEREVAVAAAAAVAVAASAGGPGSGGGSSSPGENGRSPSPGLGHSPKYGSHDSATPSPPGDGSQPGTVSTPVADEDRVEDLSVAGTRNKDGLSATRVIVPLAGRKDDDQPLPSMQQQQHQHHKLFMHLLSLCNIIYVELYQSLHLKDN
ncbi:uncharacterized protein LOC124622976 [Schistocerca americana]|uniref:uncharacterized protein LOC124622976 n=1 Tax=Schistocerca americana TaxID=7009 RepID=UPI001F4FCF1E|nr:uncharacterized protein LOC124622976 [Schistocerca americana]